MSQEIQAKRSSSSPITHLAVIGGGRWARVIAKTLHQTLPPGMTLSIHSQRNVEALKVWRDSLHAGKKIIVSDVWPTLTEARGCAVIVANAARDHMSAVRRALLAGAPVLVEKPIALTAAEVKALMGLSEDKALLFAAAHVFCFAPYLQNFAKCLPSSIEIETIRIRWSDPKVEARYGEVKQYDPGVPVYADCMPHIVSILERLFPGERLILDTIQFYRGGASLILYFFLEGKMCEVSLERRAAMRERVIEVRDKQGKNYQLDFSMEPGMIYQHDDMYSADPDWESKARPMEQLLGSFLACISDGTSDARLDPNLGLSAVELIEEIKIQYDEWQSKCLLQHFSEMADILCDDLKYACGELLQRSDRLSEQEVMSKLASLRGTFDGRVDEAWLASA